MILSGTGEGEERACIIEEVDLVPEPDICRDITDLINLKINRSKNNLFNTIVTH